MAKAKKAKPAKKSPAKKAAKAPPGQLGCCNIIYDDDRPSEQVPNVTKDGCTRLANVRGGHGQWNPGACA